MPDCGVHYLWFAFVCFLIRSPPPPPPQPIPPAHRPLHRSSRTSPGAAGRCRTSAARPCRTSAACPASSSSRRTRATPRPSARSCPGSTWPTHRRAPRAPSPPNRYARPKAGQGEGPGGPPGTAQAAGVHQKGRDLRGTPRGGWAVGGGCQSGCGRLLSVANAIEGGLCRQGYSGWA